MSAPAERNLRRDDLARRAVTPERLADARLHLPSAQDLGWRTIPALAERAELHVVAGA